jgi:hypothetical protein
MLDGDALGRQVANCTTIQPVDFVGSFNLTLSSSSIPSRPVQAIIAPLLRNTADYLAESASAVSISGSGLTFGTSPVVSLSSSTCQVISVTNTSISCARNGGKLAVGQLRATVVFDNGLTTLPTDAPIISVVEDHQFTSCAGCPLEVAGHLRIAGTHLAGDPLSTVAYMAGSQVFPCATFNITNVYVDCFLGQEFPGGTALKVSMTRFGYTSPFIDAGAIAQSSSSNVGTTPVGAIVGPVIAVVVVAAAVIVALLFWFRKKAREVHTNAIDCT